MSKSKIHNHNNIINLLVNRILAALLLATSFTFSASAAVQGAVTETYLPDRDYQSCVVITRLLQYKSTGSQVTQLQNMLVDLGYLEMQPTGFFGRATEAAVRRWQYNYKIEPVGWTGPATRASIAGVTCGGDANAIERARNGAPAVQYTAPAVQAPVTSTQPVVVLPTSTPVTILPPATTTQIQSGVYLSSVGGNFFLKRSPVNPLFFTYKVATDKPSYICIEIANAYCNDSNNYTQLISAYQPGYYDAIPATDKWLLTLYYSPEKWGSAGSAKRIFFRSSTTAQPEIYIVRVVDSL